MSQFPPDWDFDDITSMAPRFPVRSRSNSITTPYNDAHLDYEVAELRWENGQISMQALCPPRVPESTHAPPRADETRAVEPLEAIIDQVIEPLSPGTPTRGLSEDAQVPTQEVSCSEEKVFVLGKRVGARAEEEREQNKRHVEEEVELNKE